MNGKLRVHALLISVTLVLGMAVVSAPAASAETLYRNGASKVTIYPVGAPDGSAVTKARVTVKKGKKTVAKNKSSYRAKKGKYKVTSTVTYFYPGSETWVPPTTGPATTAVVPVTEADMAFEKCTVTGRTVANRTVQAVDFYDASGMDDWATVRGQAAITYTGNCTAEISTQGYVKHAWADEWTELEDVWETIDMTAAEYAAFNAQVWLENELAKNSSVLYPRFVGDEVSYPGDGSELDKAGSITVTVPGPKTDGYWTSVPATPSTTVKSTRTVVVK